MQNIPSNWALPFTEYGLQSIEMLPGMDMNIKASDLVQFGRGLEYYQFGVIESNVHMAWMRAVAGRLNSDYRYSPAIYYNFPWCQPNFEQCLKIINTAKGILSACEKFPDATLADLYNNRSMPRELWEAHEANDRAVMDAYGFDIKMTETDIVNALFKIYTKLTKGEVLK